MCKVELLKSVMNERKMSATELAYIIGVREQTIYNWMHGKHKIRKPMRMLLAKVFKNNEFIS